MARTRTGRPRENGSGPGEQWNLRLTVEDEERFKAVNARLVRKGLTKGNKMEFFRFLLNAAFAGLQDSLKEDKIQDALKAYELAKEKEAQARAVLETLIAAQNPPQPEPAPPTPKAEEPKR